MLHQQNDIHPSALARGVLLPSAVCLSLGFNAEGVALKVKACCGWYHGMTLQCGRDRNEDLLFSALLFCGEKRLLLLCRCCSVLWYICLNIHDAA